MSKANNGDDFDLLYEAYTGSDEEDKNKKVEDEEDTVEEGMFDRIKARAGAVKKALGSTEDSYQTAKASSIVSTHLKKIDSELSRLATDMVKLGVMDESDAEKMAQSVSQRLRRQAEFSPHKPDQSTLASKKEESEV
jgi:hypothetical protein